MGASESTAQPSLPADVPAKMQAARLVKHVPVPVDSNIGLDEHLRPCFDVAEVDTPKLRSHEVLVKMECSPINPSDLSTLNGTYNSAQREELPCLLGFEGSGTVVATGGNMMGWYVKGKRVACVSGKGGRMWAQYAAVPATQCLPLPDDVSFEEGSSCFVNPLTAMSFIEIAKSGSHRAILHTAAASALGKMLLRLCLRYHIQLICVVRKQTQKEALEKLGAKHVVVTDSEEKVWSQRVHELCGAMKCRLAFDAVSGKLTGSLLRAMPAKTVVHVYGGLSNENISGVRTSDLIFSGKQLKGFWLTPYLKTKNLVAQKMLLDKVASLIKTDLKTDVQSTHSLAELPEALHTYVNSMSGGKVCISPQKGLAPAPERKEPAQPAEASPAPAPAPGAARAEQPVDEEVRGVCAGLRDSVEARAQEAGFTGSFQQFELMTYRKQVVAGTVYFVKVQVAEEEEAEHSFVHIKVFKPLPHTGQPAEVSAVKMATEQDALEYF